jgi:hypothetical protein
MMTPVQSAVIPTLGFVSEFHNQTTIHPVGLGVVLLLAVATLAVPRRYALIPMLIIACLIPSAQRFVLAGADFTFVRVIAIAGLLRILLKREYTGLKWMALDTVVVAWGVVGIIMQSLLWGEFSYVFSRIGFTVETLSIYFFGRVMLRDWNSLRSFTGALAALAITVGPFIVIEYLTRRNMFSVFGGVSSVTMVRDGRVRCQGAFSHPILAGVFWATLLPLVASRLWYPVANRWVAILATASCLWIAVASASATPLGTLAAVVLGAMAFKVRHYMRLIQWGVLFTLIGLHLVMKGPVWSLIARTNVVGGSTGYHRYLLVDRAIAYFGEWALYGVQSTAHWGRGLFDVTNQYVLEGVRGGVLLMGLFVASIWISFVYVGRAWRKFQFDRSKLIFCWALGVSIFGHAASFIGVSYFGQIIMLWYVTLAAAGALGEMTAKAPVAQRARRRKRLATPTAASRASRAGYRERLSARIARAESAPTTGSPNS